jgi:hypothetical protein
MPDVVDLLRAADPAAASPPIADRDAIRARITATPRPQRERTRRAPSRRLAAACGIAVVAVGGTAVAARLLTAHEVFTSPNAAGQGDTRHPVRPVPGTERIVARVAVPAVGVLEIWAADGAPNGTCLGARLPNGRWAGTDARDTGGTPPQCFTQRDDPMFRDTLVPTGIDALEVDVDAPRLQRVVYGVIDDDVPATAVRIVDRVTGTTARVHEGRFFAYLDPRADPQRDDHQLVAYDAAGRIVTGEPVAGQDEPLGRTSP